MNIQNLMAQAQKMKKDIEKKQEEINQMTFEGKSEGAIVQVNGKKEIKKIEINKSVIQSKDDFEILEDMLLIAINDAFKKVDEETNAKLGAYGNGLNGLI